MAILCTSGRTAIALAVASRPIHLAWGEGSPIWDTDHSVTVTFAADIITLAHPSISAVVVRSADGLTTYIAGNDYTVSYNTGIITRVPGGAIAADATVTVMYHVDHPAENIEATSLLAELGRRAVTTYQFVVADANGAIQVPQGRFSVSATPTNNLYLRWNFDYDDAAAATIRELAVMLDTVPLAGLPIGQVYFTPAQVQDPGTLLALQHIAAIQRSPVTKQSFEFVLTF